MVSLTNFQRQVKPEKMRRKMSNRSSIVAPLVCFRIVEENKLARIANWENLETKRHFRAVRTAKLASTKIKTINRVVRIVQEARFRTREGRVAAKVAASENTKT